jgi:aspartyl-tRNA(Asn)/glutamyl-tRNA(Gln) amidotransferase subunit B
VGIRRIHLEEDAGKLVHVVGSGGEAEGCLVDYNRSSVPLLEIVTDHTRRPLRSAREARTYLEKLRQTLQYIDVSKCLLERGQFRNDVNVSVRPRGCQTFGNRAEIKNMSSFRFIMEAIEHEIVRQTEVLEAGGEVDQETRLFDEAQRVTRPMRSKEDAPDYRYFPDPDLVTVDIDEALIRQLEATLPELPSARLSRLIEEHGIARADALLLTRQRPISEFFLACAGLCTDTRRLGHWITKELFTLLKSASISVQGSELSPERFSALVNLVSAGTLTERIARAVLREMLETKASPDDIVEAKGLAPIDDVKRLSRMVDDVLRANPRPADQVRAGDDRPLNFLVGQVMKASEGKAQPQRVRELILSRIRQ